MILNPCLQKEGTGCMGKCDRDTEFDRLDSGLLIRFSNVSSNGCTSIMQAGGKRSAGVSQGVSRDVHGQ